MSDQLYEQISAFVDGELQEHETELLLKRLEREPELRARLVRYSTIGATFREGAGRGATRAFAARVSAAIASSGAMPGSQPLHARLNPRWLRTIAGLGVAATVAAVAIVGVQQLQAPLPGAVTQVQVATTSPASQPIVIGDLSSPAPSYTVPAPTTDVPLVPAARLTNYVVAHSQYSSTFGRRNMLSGIISEDPTPVDETGEPVPPPPVTQP
jgi:sigma-E factor negative regulatory protein RseA